MQANPTLHIVDGAAATTLCGRTPPSGGRWRGKLLSQDSFHANDCEDCIVQAALLNIWKPRPGRDEKEK